MKIKFAGWALAGAGGSLLANGDIFTGMLLILAGVLYGIEAQSGYMT